MLNVQDYVRQAAQKYGWFKYYLTLWPARIGTHPKEGLMDFINYDSRTEVEGKKVWAEIYYNRQLTKDELNEYEMVAGF